MIFGLGAEIWPNCHFEFSSSRWAFLEMINWPYLSPWAKKQKNKDALLPWTLKVEESKVPLLYLFLAKGLKYDHFVISKKAHREEETSKWQFCHISAPRPNIKKIKALCFLQLVKLNNGKYLLIFGLGSEIWPLCYLGGSSSRGATKITIWPLGLI